jgi:hypothetical protein
MSMRQFLFCTFDIPVQSIFTPFLFLDPVAALGEFLAGE